MDQRTLIVRFGSLGDLLLTTPTVLNLKLARPHDRITFVTKERFAPLVAGFDGVDEVVSLPNHASAKALLTLLFELDRRNFDLVVDLHGNLRSWLVRKFVAANRKIVYPKRRLERRAAVKHKQIPRDYPHTIDLYNSALTAFGFSTPCHRPLLRLPELPAEDIPFAGRTGPVAVIAPGAAHPNKQWPLERFAETARILHASTDARIIWAVTANDAGISGLEKDLPAEAFIEIVDSPIERLGAIIATADVTIANDSGIAHLSSAVGTPVLSIFGPTHPVLGFAPRGLYDRVIEVDEPCRPCSLHGKKPCYREERFCFTRIAPGLVAEEAAGIIASNLNKYRAILIDRDGTVIIDKDYLSNPDQVELIDGSVEALKAATAAGYKLVIVSNQSGVARGYFSLEDVERVNARLLELLLQQGVRIDALYFCPHYPGEGADSELNRDCDCRKPSPGMAEQAALELSVDLRRSFVIGDSLGDLNLGRVIGATSLLVRTGYGGTVENKIVEIPGRFQPPVFNSLKEAVKFALQQ